MYGILLSALNAVLAWLVRSVLVKFVVYFALYFVVTEFMSLIASWMPNGQALSSSLGGIPATVWYFLDLFNFSFGFPVVVSAFATRFIVRRIPVIG